MLRIVVYFFILGVFSHINEEKVKAKSENQKEEQNLKTKNNNILHNGLRF